jgi:hypothetical protein
LQQCWRNVTSIRMMVTGQASKTVASNTTLMQLVVQESFRATINGVHTVNFNSQYIRVTSWLQLWMDYLSKLQISEMFICEKKCTHKGQWKLSKVKTCSQEVIPESLCTTNMSQIVYIWKEKFWHQSVHQHTSGRSLTSAKKQT